MREGFPPPPSTPADCEGRPCAVLLTIPFLSSVLLCLSLFLRLLLIFLKDDERKLLFNSLFFIYHHYQVYIYLDLRSHIQQTSIVGKLKYTNISKSEMITHYVITTSKLGLPLANQIARFIKRQITVYRQGIITNK